MKNGLFVGLAVGMLAGAVLVNNSSHARQMLSSAQEQVKGMMKNQSQGMMDCCCGGSEMGSHCEQPDSMSQNG